MNFKKILFLILSFILFFAAIFKQTPIETNLVSAFLKSSSSISPLIKITEVSNKNLNIILEAENLEDLEEAKSQFETDIPIKELTDVYKDYPANFLTDNSRNLIKNSYYKKLNEEALERLYNPFGLFIAPPSEDPYLFSNEFVFNNFKYQNSDKFINGKYYSLINVKINSQEDIEKYLSVGVNGGVKGVSDVNIYLTGTPIHSYMTTKKSVLEINIICLISTLAFIFLCKSCFNSYKIIIPIGLSILFGFIFGYSASALLFSKLHILTFVFSTSLIGISLDYSLHHFIAGDEKGFKKNLTASMFTTICAFLVLALSGIEVLREISVFTGFGLLGVYLFVIIVLDKNIYTAKFKIPALKFNNLYIVLFILIIALGLTKLSFNDNIQNLYTPPKELAFSEKLYNDIFKKNSSEFLLIEGENLNEILKKEESLKLENYLGLSKFISSKEKQRENFELVKKLYQKDLESYAKFLSDENKKSLKSAEFKPYDVNNFALKNEFLLDKRTSFIVVPKHIEGSISPSGEISKYLKNIRKDAIKLIFPVFAVLFILLTTFYGTKNALRIIASPIFGVLTAISIISLMGLGLNLFNILALFLIIGFSIDYSIFRLNCSKKSEPAVFISVLSTGVSFLLLSFTGFKLISSLALTLFIGITFSYLASLFMIKSKNE